MAAVASAGADQIVQQGELVTLDATGSVGNLEWSLTDDGGTGFDGTYLMGAFTSAPTFTAPGTAGVLTFTLVATEGDGETVTTDSDTVTVTVELTAALERVYAPPYTPVEYAPSRRNLEVYSALRGGQTVVAQLPMLESLSFEYLLNAPGSARFTVPNERLPDGRPLDSVLTPNVHEVLIVQGSKVVWAGPVLTVQEEPLGAPGIVEIGCEGLWAYTRRWFIWNPIEGATTTYTSDENSEESYPPGRVIDVDQTTILQRLVEFNIDHPWGATDGYYFDTESGVAASGVLRTRTYSPTELPNVYEMAENLSNVEKGFDFDLGPDRVLRTWYPARGRWRGDLVLHNGNVVSLTRQIDGTQQASRVLGIGAGEGPDQLRFSRTDWPARKTYGPTQAVYTNTDVSHADTLEQQLLDELDAYRDNPETYTLTVRAETAVGLEPGDIIRINYASGYSDVDVWARITGVKFEPFNDTAELVMS